MLSSLAGLSSHRCQDPSQDGRAGPWVPPGHRTHENISHPFAPACLSLWHLADGWHLPHRGWEGGEDGTRTKTAGVSLKLTPVPGQLSREAQCLALEEGEGGEGRAGWRGGVTMFKVQVWGAGQGQSPRQEQLGPALVSGTQRLLCPSCPLPAGPAPPCSVLSAQVSWLPACQRCWDRTPALTALSQPPGPRSCWR